MNKTCTICKVDQPIENFNKKNSSPDGKQNVCRECNRARSRKYYSENPHLHRANVKERNNRVKLEHREWLFNYFLEHPCVDCGNSDIRVLEFDHIEGAEKVAGVGRLIASSYSMEKIQEEIEKCEVRCRNCHQIKTFDRMGGTWHDKYMAVV